MPHDNNIVKNDFLIKLGRRKKTIGNKNKRRKKIVKSRNAYHYNRVSIMKENDFVDFLGDEKKSSSNAN